MLIRPARTEDWPSVSDLSRVSGYTDWINEMGIEFVETGHPIVAEEGTIIGFAKAEDSGDGSMWFSALRVHPDHRRKGIGEALTGFAMELAKRNKARCSRMLIEPSNIASINLVKKFRFEIVETYDLFSGSFDISNWPASKSMEDFYVGAGFPFVRFRDYKRNDVSVKEKGNAILFEKIMLDGTPFQTAIIKGAFQGSSVNTGGYVAVSTKWKDQVAKFLKPLEGFSRACLYETVV